MSLDPDMLPTRVSAESSQPAPSPSPIDSAHQSLSTGAQDVWFYMADAESQNRPSDDVVAETIAADSLRQSTLAFHLFKKPKSTRIRCTLCLREKNEWRTWLNRIGGISRPMREHLSKEHPTTYNQKCNEQGVGVRAGARSFSVPPAGTQSEEPEIPASEPASNSASSSGKPIQIPQHDPPPHIQHAQPPLPPPQHPQPAPNYPQPAQPYPQPPYPRPQHYPPWEPDRRKSALELAQEAVDIASRPRATETVEELRAELEQVKAQRDHELNARRLLEQELYRVKEAARARDEELVKVSHLISASLQALAGASAPPAAPPGAPPQGPYPHPQFAYPYHYPYPYPSNPA
ncbi:hypothetical protein FRC12_006237 [Ceratobasidium sp. 428]|nr:hypothetical protein FRC12_006237 [Ceratobasidium sp. 428]